MGRVVSFKARSRGKAKADKDPVIEPTPEQMGDGRFALEDVTDKRNGGGTITIGKAYRRRPMIDVLYDQSLFSDREYKALQHYRHHADLVDRSLVRDSLCFQRGGSGAGPTITTLNAIRLVTDVERAVGSLLDILRAVVVYDKSLSQWAIERMGGKEQCRKRKGKVVCAIEPSQKALAIAKLEIRIAAERVESELSA